MRAKRKLSKRFKPNKTTLIVLLALVSVVGVYWIFFSHAATIPALSAFPLRTTKADIADHWPSAEKRSYALNYNVHHDYNASDIFAPCGRIVQVAKAGTIYSARHYAAEDQVAIHGSDGIYYAYYHLTPNSMPSNITSGASVGAGTTLGTVGNAGGECGNGSHVHFQATPGPPPSCKDSACAAYTFYDVQSQVTAAFNKYASSWTKMPDLPNGLQATDIGVMNSVNVAATDGRVYRLNSSSWTQLAGTGTSHIDMDPSNPWRINTADHSHVFRGPAWTYMNATASDIGIGSSGVVWLVGTNGNTYKWNGSTSSPSWPRQSTTPPAPFAKRIDVSAGGGSWIISNESETAGNIYYWSSNVYKKITGGAIDIGIGGDNGVWIVNSSATVYKWNGSTTSPHWNPTLQGGGKAISVDVHGKPWIIGKNGQVYVYWRNTP